MLHSRIVFRIVIICLCVSACSFAPALADCIDYRAFLHRAGVLDVPYGGDGIAIPGPGGSLAYIPAGESGLYVVDFSDDHSPRIVGSVDTPGYASCVAVSREHAFVADGETGIQVIDVHDPLAPALVAGVDTGDARSVALGGDYLYVAGGLDGLQVVEIADPRDPGIIGSVDTPGTAMAADLAGDYVYIADLGGVCVVDIATPSDPSLVTVFQTAGEALDIAVRDNRAYVAEAYSHGCEAIDISDPSHPSSLATVAFPAPCYSIAAMGTRAYAADCDYGLRVVDFADPQSARIVASYPTPGHPYGVSLTEGLAWLSCMNDLVELVDIASVEPPPLVGRVELGYGVWDVTVADPYAYVAQEGLRVVDLSDPRYPVLVGSAWTMGSPFGVVVSGDYAYLATTSGLEVFDVHTASNPLRVGWAPEGYGYGVDVQGSYAYLACGDVWDSGLRVIDVSDPTNPVLVGNMQTTTYVYGVTVVGIYAYAFMRDGLAVVDVRDPEAPRSVGWLALPGGPENMVVCGSIAYLTNGAYGLVVIDVSNPQEPLWLGNVDGPGFAAGLAVSQESAYITTRSPVGGLHVIDVRDPLAPRCVGDAVSQEWCVAVDLMPGYVCVATFTGLEIRPQQCAAAGIGGGIVEARPSEPWFVPNPAAQGTTVRLLNVSPGEASVSIHDTAGRRVRSLFEGVLSGSVGLTWDGRDDRARTVPPGLYVARIAVDGRVQSARVTLVH